MGESRNVFLRELLCGFLNGFFGSGGGVAAVPVLEHEQRGAGNTPAESVRRAHANSVAVIFVLSAVAAVSYFFSGGIVSVRQGIHSLGCGRRGSRSGVPPEDTRSVAPADFRSADMRGGGEGAVLMMNAVVGLLTGIIASMGLGGGFVLLIWLTMFQDMPQRAAQGINLLFFLPIALVSVVMHARAGLIDKRLVWSLIPGGILGAVLGTTGSQAGGK